MYISSSVYIQYHAIYFLIYLQVSQNRKWAEVVSALKLEDNNATLPAQLEKLYASLLYQFEQLYNYRDSGKQVTRKSYNGVLGSLAVSSITKCTHTCKTVGFGSFIIQYGLWLLSLRLKLFLSLLKVRLVVYVMAQRGGEILEILVTIEW